MQCGLHFYFFTINTVFILNNKMVWNISTNKIINNYEYKNNIKCGYFKNIFINIDQSPSQVTSVYSGTIDPISSVQAQNDPFNFSNSNTPYNSESSSNNIAQNIGNALTGSLPPVQIIHVISGIVGDIKDPKEAANNIKHALGCYFNGCGNVRSSQHYSGTKKI